MQLRKLAWLATVSVLGVAPALAHTPYLRPYTFAPNRDTVTIEAGVSEGGFFIPDFPIRGEGAFTAISPSGERVTLPVAGATKSVALLELPLTAEGTWRIGSGLRAGRSGKWAKIDGQWRPVRPAPPAGAPAAPRPQAAAAGEAERPASGPIAEADLPAGAEILNTQSFQQSETYVTKGAPSAGALKPSGQGFELAPKTNPTEIFAGEPFRFAFLLDGQAAAGVRYSVSKAWDVYSEPRYGAEGQTDAKGEASLTIEDPGVYVLEARYPAAAPGQAPAAKSYAYTLTFEVTR